MLLVLAVLLVAVPLLELYVIIQVADVIGGWETIGLLLLESVIGAWLVKREGLSVMARIDDALRNHRLPHKELVDGFLIMLAGALMLAPGFLTDLVGFVLLIPPTRALVRALLRRRFRNRLGVGAGFFGAANMARGGGRRVWVDSTVVDTTAREPGAKGPERGPPDEVGPGRY